MIGVCGPYNLGGSATAGTRALLQRILLVLLLKNFKNNITKIVFKFDENNAPDLPYVKVGIACLYCPICELVCERLCK
jgi:hypothetical protein